MALIGIATIPFYFLLQALSMKDMGPKTAEMNGHLAQVSSTMVELVSGIKVVKAFGKTGEAHRNYADAASAFSQSYWDWCAPLIGLCSIAGELISSPLLLLINLGGGADFSITRNWDVSAGFKWMIQTAKDYIPGFVKRKNPIVINIGATYRF